MSEIKFTDQRPRTTTLELPEGNRAKKLPKDPELVAFLERMKVKLLERVEAEGKE